MTLSFEKRFPTEEERYDKYIWLIKLSIIAQFCSYLAYMLLDANAVSIMQTVKIVLWLLINIVVLQIAWKSRALHFLIRLFFCAVISIFITMVFMQFLGFWPLVLGAVITIFANRKHLKLYVKYKAYLKYLAIWLGMSIMVYIAAHIGAVGTDPALLYLLKRVLLFYVFWRLLQHECAQGRPFRETIRILMLMPIIPLFMLVGWFSIIPIGPLSSKKIFGEEGHDFFELQPEKNG